MLKKWKRYTPETPHLFRKTQIDTPYFLMGRTSNIPFFARETMEKSPGNALGALWQGRTFFISLRSPDVVPVKDGPEGPEGPEGWVETETPETMARFPWYGENLTKVPPKMIWLVVWNMNFIFSPRVGMMIQSDFHIFQRGWSHQPDGDVRYFQECLCLAEWNIDEVADGHLYLHQRKWWDGYNMV